MATKKPKKTAKSTDDTDVKIMQAWLAFQNSLENTFNYADAYVDLAFESSIDSKTHYSFDVEEVIYLSGVKVTPSGFIAFTVPHGTKEKAFLYKDSDLVTVTGVDPSDANKRTFQEVVDEAFKEAFKDIPEFPSIRKLEVELLAKAMGMPHLFNMAAAYLDEVDKKKVRLELYDKVDMFGLF